MSQIQNISFQDVKSGNHITVTESTVLIQIVDPGMEFPTPAHTFKEVHQFQFLDIEERVEGSFTDTHAAEIISVLKKALDNDSDVVVHCIAGICRSGAVCEVGVMLGFDDTKNYRNPNLLVKHSLMRSLGWYY